MINDNDNKKVYNIEVKTGEVSLLYPDCDIGSYAAYYESLDEDVLYIFSRKESKLFILSYTGENDPIILPYLSTIDITKVLFRVDRNKLKIFGVKKNSESKIIADIDLFTGEINNIISCDVETNLVTVINNRNYALLYFKKDSGHVSVYKYDAKLNSLTMITESFPSVTGNKIFKLDGIYERDDFIGMNIANNDTYIANLYRFKLLRPEKEVIGDSLFPIILGNQSGYNASGYNNVNSALTLKGVYEIYKINDNFVRLNKVLKRLEVIGDEILYINCEKVLWVSEFYNDIVISVLYNNITTLYDIDIINNRIRSTKDLSLDSSLHKRNTTETTFIPVINTQSDIISGVIYLVAGESEASIFQDILALKIEVKEVSSIYTISFTSQSVKPGGYGVYKSKILKIASDEVAVIFGLSLENNSTHNVDAIVNKPLSNITTHEIGNIRYLKTNIQDGTFSHVTATPSLIDDPNRLVTPKGIVGEAFILSNHVFITASNYRFAGEIVSNRISDLIQFKEYINALPVPIQEAAIDGNARFNSEINKNTTSLSVYNKDNLFNNLFSYYFDKLYLQSRFEDFKHYITEIYSTTIKVNKAFPDKVDIIKLIYPSIVDGYEFDIIFMKEYLDVDSIEKVIVFDRVPSTPYRIDLSKRITYTIQGTKTCSEIGFSYDLESNELIKDDSSLMNDSWEVFIANGNLTERKIKIVLDRFNREGNIFEINGNDVDFPFTNDIVPVLLTYGELELTGYRYCVFIDVKGNVATFDRKSCSFVHADGLEDVTVPYFSGELIVFPSKTTLQGSIGKRVWGYSGENPYINQPDNISVNDETLIEN
jgi:hypothetical protein